MRGAWLHGLQFKAEGGNILILHIKLAEQYMNIAYLHIDQPIYMERDHETAVSSVHQKCWQKRLTDLDEIQIGK